MWKALLVQLFPLSADAITDFITVKYFGCSLAGRQKHNEIKMKILTLLRQENYVHL